jgi:RNA:NAD 2'-phosphotransferase (TPT1/KptA family)
MNDDRLVRVSKYLSKHLRHQPERLGHLFYRSENGIWLVEHVPSTHLRAL